MDALKQAYVSCYGECIGDRTINKLSLFIAMFESSEMFAKIARDLKENLCIDIDRDVDYGEWGKPETWRLSKTKTPSTASSLTYEMLNIEKTGIANRMSDMLPPEPEKVKSRKPQKDKHELTYSEREKFKTTINHITDEHVFNDLALDHAIDRTLMKLCAALQKIGEIVEGIHSQHTYEKLYESTLFASNMQLTKTEVNVAHQEWRSRYLDDDITEDSLLQHAHTAIVDLFKAGVLDGIEANATNEQKAKYKEEINFDDDDIPKKMKPRSLYIPFRDIYRYKGVKYTANKVKAGRLLFKIRKDTDKLQAYFRFELTLQLIYKDLEALRNKDKIESVKDGIDFAQLKCRFSEEEVMSADIHHAQAAATLALMDKLAEGKPKIYWGCFYCVLLEKGWIEDNVNGFCNKMNGLFDIGLDNSSFSKLLKNGSDISQWGEEDSRLKERKAFGLKFKTLLDFMLDYKVKVCTQENES